MTDKMDYTPEEIAKAFEIAGGKEKVRETLLSAKYHDNLVKLAKGTVAAERFGPHLDTDK